MTIILVTVIWLCLIGMLVNRIVSLQGQVQAKNRSIDVLLSTVDELQGIVRTQALRSVFAQHREDEGYVQELTQRLHRREWLH